MQGLNIRQQSLEKIECVIKNGQFRDFGNIGHTRHRTKTNTTKTEN